MVPRHVAYVPICRILTLPLGLFPSSGGFFVFNLALASVLCFPLCATCSALDTDHRCVTAAAKICNLTLCDTLQALINVWCQNIGKNIGLAETEFGS